MAVLQLQRSLFIPKSQLCIVTLCPFCRLDDHSIKSKVDEQYEYNLKRYIKISFDDFHTYIRKKVASWLHWFPHKDDLDYTETEAAPVVQVNAIGVVEPPEFELSDVEEQERIGVGGNQCGESTSCDEESQKNSVEKAADTK